MGTQTQLHFHKITYFNHSVSLLPCRSCEKRKYISKRLILQSDSVGDMTRFYEETVRVDKSCLHMPFPLQLQGKGRLYHNELDTKLMSNLFSAL